MPKRSSPFRTAMRRGGGSLDRYALCPFDEGRAEVGVEGGGADELKDEEGVRALVEAGEIDEFSAA